MISSNSLMIKIYYFQESLFWLMNNIRFMWSYVQYSLPFLMFPIRKIHKSLLNISHPLQKWFKISSTLYRTLSISLYSIKCISILIIWQDISISWYIFKQLPTYGAVWILCFEVLGGKRYLTYEKRKHH